MVGSTLHISSTTLPESGRRTPDGTKPSASFRNHRRGVLERVEAVRVRGPQHGAGEARTGRCKSGELRRSVRFSMAAAKEAVQRSDRTGLYMARDLVKPRTSTSTETNRSPMAGGLGGWPCHRFQLVTWPGRRCWQRFEPEDLDYIDHPSWVPQVMVLSLIRSRTATSVPSSFWLFGVPWFQVWI